MYKEVIKNATPEQFYENVSGRLYTLSLNQTGGVECNMYCSIKDIEAKDQRIFNLEAKLAEREKELKLRKSLCKACQSIDNQTAIAELEKVKKSVLNLNREEYLKRFYELEDIEISRNDVVDIIDQQINDLRSK